VRAATQVWVQRGWELHAAVGLRTMFKECGEDARHCEP